MLNYHLGAVLLKLGQKDEARERLNKALAGRGRLPRPGRGGEDAQRLAIESGNCNG